MMRLMRLILLALTITLAPSAMAETYDSGPLTCFAGATDATDWATTVAPSDATNKIQTTTLGSGTETNASYGFRFVNTDLKKIECVWVVPENYDQDSVDVPWVTLMGWSVEDDSCFFSCPSEKTVRLEVSSRTYSDNAALNGAWTNQGNADFQFPGVGTSPKVYKSSLLRVQNIVAITDDANNFGTGRPVFIKLERDTGVTDNLPETFYLSTVFITWPTD